ncbi:hypothetical protein EG68_00676 [Paragonimus skrjabini miyazakii]|uniref:Uncharacterized protein n=1 Tax=Paragonimus skrjabini miyazakii TaxID=59628 RepID=A0A8S9Z964_9TREM|nr:hypothetical protein EG68_00676 [Paragonimus skrjabini miyazakii]
METEFWDNKIDEPSLIDQSEPSMTSKSSTYSRSSIYHCAQTYLLPAGSVQQRPVVVNVECNAAHKRAVKQNYNRCYRASYTKFLNLEA